MKILFAVLLLGTVQQLTLADVVRDVEGVPSQGKGTSSKNGQKTEKRSVSQIAMVDMKKVASECKAGIGINDQLRKINDAARARLLPLEEQVKKESEKLKTDAIRTEEMQAALYDTVKTERYQISEAADRAVDHLKAAIKEVIEKLAKKRRLVVFDSEAILSAENVEDVTADVIAELDNYCSHIEIKLEPIGR